MEATAGAYRIGVDLNRHAVIFLKAVGFLRMGTVRFILMLEQAGADTQSPQDT